jgi:NACHT domain
LAVLTNRRCREQVSQLKLKQSDRLKDLDVTTQKVIDAIVQQQDVFRAAYDTQMTLTRTLHAQTVTSIETARTEIIQEIRVRFLCSLYTTLTNYSQRPKQAMAFTEQQQLLATLPHATQAAFNSPDSQHDPLCLQKTRVEVLDQITAWADRGDERWIFWLNGMAGTGKSTIARTIARQYYDQKRLGASFFFSRGTADRSHAGKFLSTIAMHLAHISPALKEHICRAVAEHNYIANQSLRDQWKHLIVQPLSMWRATSGRFPLILVIDALDECNGDKDIQQILELFAEVELLRSIQLRIFVTSRPETPIRLGFRNTSGILHRDLALHQISPTIVNNDISIFFKHKLEEIRNASDDLPVGWPGKDIIGALVLKAHGLFIYAATVCRFIEQKGEQWPPDDLLRLILLNGTTDDSSPRNASNTNITDDSPTKDLDEMYSQILEHSFTNINTLKDRQNLTSIFRQVIGAIVILFNPLPAISIARLLDIDNKRIQMRLRHLHSVLEVPDRQSHPLRLLHPSLRDFLLDKKRCSNQQLWVDEKKVHADLADACIRLMSHTLGRDMCDLHSPGALAREVQCERIEQRLPAELQYACQYWVQHLERSGTQLLDNDPVHTFLCSYLLHWLEVLSLIRKTSEGVVAITSLESLITVSDSSNGLEEILTDI